MSKSTASATPKAYTATPKGPPHPPYRMRISRMTVDKLGVRLYDTASAVVAELVANGYDADADEVTIRLPLGSQLAKRNPKKKAQWIDEGFSIEVQDDGHGMTPKEASEYFLEVGRERRMHPGQGAKSRRRRRPVMGRKGIGKLAPFGICRRIEVISSGGERVPNGYITSHFVMDYDKILGDSDAPVLLETGSLDNTFRQKTGTTVRLTSFLGKRVPDQETFLRQLARRFAPTKSFRITVVDTKTTNVVSVGPLDVPIQPQTKLDLADRPVTTEDGQVLQVKGWLALARDAYKDEETTGVRIYARNKIVGWTRDFEQPAGYTGEFTMRSYLVGELHAEWLDLDDGEDLVRTDRQGIVWDSEYGNALRLWGANLIKEMGATSRAPRRKRVREIFLEKSKIEERAKKKYADQEVVAAAMDLAGKIGGFAAEDELTDPNYLNELSEVILNVAPHTALMDAFREFESAASLDKVSLDAIENLFSKTKVAEMASYGQIAYERVRVIGKLERLVTDIKDEAEFQNLIADAPWLIASTWSVISRNQQMVTFRDALQTYLKNEKGMQTVLAISNENKRPDFTLAEHGRKLHIVEIKASGHYFDDADWGRLSNYIEAFDEFFEAHQEVRVEFSAGYQITIVADGEKLTRSGNRLGLKAAKDAGKVDRLTWLEFLMRTKRAHEQFLAQANKKKSK